MVDAGLRRSPLAQRAPDLASVQSSGRISLTERGKEVHRIVAGIYEKHARTIEQIGGIPGDDFVRMNASLLRLERYWTDQIKYRL